MSVVISDAWRQRFGGTARLYGEKALQLFADAHICVVGIPIGKFTLCAITSGWQKRK